MNYNSTKNQEIKAKFVAREIYANVNSMVEYIINKGFEDADAPFNADDIENYYVYPEYSGKYVSVYTGQQEDIQNEIEELKEKIEKAMDEWNGEGDEPEIISEMEQELSELEGLEEEPQEILEWWVCSPWLIDKLKEKGEPVIEHENLWGRTTSGQAILLDAVISEICEDLEILEGQSSDWSKV
ncbi:MAG: hypothetical protein ACOC4B_00815 [Bacteroidota bacterium]